MCVPLSSLDGSVNSCGSSLRLLPAGLSFQARALRRIVMITLAHGAQADKLSCQPEGACRDDSQ
eukprot:3409696-Rhodomonas_salina.5